MSTISATEPVHRRTGIFSAGLALFSMFFGAGNLIFPLLVGKAAGEESLFAILGLSLSAVAFPLLGLVAMMFFGGNLHAFLQRLGKWPSILLLLVLQGAMGPFGCMPRLFTLMHASVKPYFPELSLFAFSILAAGAVFILTVRPHRIVDLLGTILTPIFILTLGTLVIVGMIGAPAPQPVLEGSSYYFMQGIKGGYQTMDLLSALLFATMIIPHLSKGADPKSARRRVMGASGIAALLLTASYVGLCWLSARHSWTLDPNMLPEDILNAIAVKILGPTGGMFASITVLLACLTTAISLAAVFSSYLRTDLLKNRIGTASSLAITLLLVAAFANLGFSGIVRFIGPVLEILYPALAVLCVLNIVHHTNQVKIIRAPVYGALALAAVSFCLR
ncbi:MAG: branched-chain amino acid transport system II carrier protein [Verrucomicrobia bacterium]|nr:branched-chain amino acid transport system II carrier protein [Verrucomicrobiota bacterium]